MTRTLAATLLALTLLAGACHAQDDQDDKTSREGTDPPAAPVIGAWHELVAEVDGDVVLVNGYPEDDRPRAVELWRWDGERWTPLEPDGERPSARNFSGITWDGARGELVLYGGLTPDGASDETWTWDGYAWSRATGSGPGPRSSPSLAYDAASRPVLLYGGDDGASQYDDTWAWDGAAWARVATDGPTPMRWPAFLERDPESGSPVLYGGHQLVDEDAPAAIGGTWVWVSDGWRPIRGAASRDCWSTRTASSIPTTACCSIGGSDSEEENGRVWRWTGTAWQPLGEDVMPPRQAFGLAYDERRDVVVLTGGVVEPGSVEPPPGRLGVGG